jgi:TPR repeat protein
MAEIYTKDRERRKDTKAVLTFIAEAREAAKEKCDGGDKEACKFGGDTWKSYPFYVLDFETNSKLKKEMEKELAEEKKHYEGTCQAGDVFACRRSDNQAKARAILEEKCSAGSYRECDQLTDMYWYGKGVPRESKKVLEINERMCEEQSECYNLSGMYLSGILVEKDEKKSKALLKKCCEIENPRCCQSLRWTRLGGRYSQMDGTIHLIELLD